MSETTKERPIPFSPPMVRAILEGRKTQTRRVVKPYPSWQVHSVCAPSLAAQPWQVWFHFPETERVGHMVTCRYGVPGDRLWVKETWTGGWHPTGTSPDKMHLHYAADGSERFTSAPDGYVLPKAAERCGRFVTPLFMPRWASRITLEITEVRVERLQDISKEDAIAEGLDSCECDAARWAPFLYRDYQLRSDDPAEWYSSPVDSYKSLWESIHGAGSWDANPWVWALTFKRVTA